MRLFGLAEEDSCLAVESSGGSAWAWPRSPLRNGAQQSLVCILHPVKSFALFSPQVLHWELWDESRGLGDMWCPCSSKSWRASITLLHCRPGLFASFHFWPWGWDSHGKCVCLGFVFCLKRGLQQTVYLKIQETFVSRKAQCASSWLHQRTPALEASLRSKCLSWAEKLFRQQGNAF